MALGYNSANNSYTALSTDTTEISNLIAQFSNISHGIKLYLTDTGEEKYSIIMLMNLY